LHCYVIKTYTQLQTTDIKRQNAHINRNQPTGKRQINKVTFNKDNSSYCRVAIIHREKFMDINGYLARIDLYDVNHSPVVQNVIFVTNLDIIQKDIDLTREGNYLNDV
jgi:hypothetical protein